MAEEKMARSKSAVAVTTGLVVVSGAVVAHVIRKRRRKRKRHLIPKKMRASMAEVLKGEIDTVVREGGATEAFLTHRVSKLSDKQLVALWSLAKVGRFVKDSGIDPLHPSAEQVRLAAQHYLAAAGKGHGRAEMLQELADANPEELGEALSAAADVLAEA